MPSFGRTRSRNTPFSLVQQPKCRQNWAWWLGLQDGVCVWNLWTLVMFQRSRTLTEKLFYCTGYMFPVMELFLVLKMFSVTCVSADMLSFLTLFERKLQWNVPVWKFLLQLFEHTLFWFSNFECLLGMKISNEKKKLFTTRSVFSSWRISLVFGSVNVLVILEKFTLNILWNEKPCSWQFSYLGKTRYV